MLPVYAGSQAQQTTNFPPEKIANFAKQVERYAAKQGARAFIIGRIGYAPKDLPQGIMFTHTAIAIYSQISLNDGKKVKGYVIHNLYQSDNKPHKSHLVTDYPVDFFWGSYELTAGITIPTPAVQQKLIQAINQGAASKVHNPNYSVIANPFNQKYQNCTEHTLVLLNSAIYNTTDKNRLYANIRAYFKPQTVNTNPLKLLLGSIIMEGVSTSDHEGDVKTATFISIAQYLKQYKLLYQSVSLDINGKVVRHF